ncbi:MAG: hypothetical protein COZ06_12745 [Armatimonadetes bacterium CG_4_10_14_3_um_filter_66_18]|nr:sugar phosphate isomerase/epimerase [Armatimonadota bacterium]OIO93486.1 MAG: hypothetical protein AUJ96_30155 [Armatimonadetes bacterium CG2_30_66_41]PIU90184.1 MAG: hypothetical protein COS65_25775 [Armatimonadetes bacterium CG06_land_8_20_14_3_00_66_21]PIX41700.1 MAG: hypothetical protein COZ57_22860 [Armatimonadetes bacterium CG_4_8_14_3_um_filter_66_20]PIY49786.1 MAG: hypothetical protein COZ06_12745 [Armatimonadetes bacterium CG_4_10_14_3_um_filter_66_18]PIZ51410.1 MAG: hypothetical p
MPFRIACQTITFGPSQYECFPDVFSAVKAAGYAGVEVGYRHLANHPANVLGDMLADQGLELAASHLGGNLEDAGQAEGERGMLDSILDYLNELGTALLMYSGPQYETDDQYARFVESLGRAAEKCDARGVALLYHNHWWEFANEWRAMNALFEGTPATLGFCPDVGWVCKGGADVVEFLDRVNGRLGAVHYKDFLTPALEPKDFCCLGDGVTPFAATTAWLRNHAPALWVIAEQDAADVPAEEAVARNADYLRRVVLGG